MLLGPDDIVELGINYLPSFLIAILFCIGTWLVLIRVRRHPLNFKQWSLVDICLVTTPAIAWIIYFGLTLNCAVTLTLLDSESAGVAEIAYEERFKREVKTLDEAVRLAVNKHRAPNVRFYAACLVAER